MSVKPESVGLSSAKLAHLDRYVQARYIDTGKLPGVQMLVHRRGETAHFSTLGKADVARDRPLTDDTVFRIYSMTKPLTSVAFMMLVEEGLIALDDRV